MHEPRGRAAAASYLHRNATSTSDHAWTKTHVLGRLMAGSSYEFERAVDRRSRNVAAPNTKTVAGVAVEAAVVLLHEVHAGGTDWHLHRGLEAMHHIDWLWRKGTTIANHGQEAA